MNDTYIQTIIEKENVTIEKDVIENIKFNYSPDLRSTINCLQNYHSNPTPIINQQMIDEVCKNYHTVKLKVKEYVKMIYFKDFLIKLFIKMIDYKIDKKLLSMMKDLIVVKQDFDYFDTLLMPHFVNLNR